MTANSYRSHQGRRIGVYFHSTPQLYVAYFEEEYDGAPDSRHPYGMARTEEGAIEALIECDSLGATGGDS